jgi:hypothetical protein
MKSWPDRDPGHPFLAADEGSGDFRPYQSSSNSEKLAPFREKVGNLLPRSSVVSIVPWRSCPDDSALPVGAITMIAYNTIDATATSGLESPIRACPWQTACPDCAIPVSNQQIHTEWTSISFSSHAIWLAINLK